MGFLTPFVEYFEQKSIMYKSGFTAQKNKIYREKISAK